MKPLIRALDLRTLVRSEEWQPTVILILAALLTACHRYFGSPDAARRIMPGCDGITAATFMFASAFVLFGLVPFCVLVIGFREHPSDYGLQWGNWRLGAGLLLALLPLITAAFLYPASGNAEVRAFYPFAPEAGSSIAKFLLLQIPRGALYYSAWEFFFRGFMLFGMRRYVGDWLAVCVQTIPQCLWHIGLPTGEILSSIGGGVLFGVIALRTRSIIWPMLLHYAMGIVLDILIIARS
ncbi:MAG TPA: type II CAAX endopeptidase family protein [Bacteroidota bacterium]|nr:type II CAAX endopeptidase family protein [Bacteroidota bacterium]